MHQILLFCLCSFSCISSTPVSMPFTLIKIYILFYLVYFNNVLIGLSFSMFFPSLLSILQVPHCVYSKLCLRFHTFSYKKLFGMTYFLGKMYSLQRFGLLSSIWKNWAHFTSKHLVSSPYSCACLVKTAHLSKVVSSIIFFLGSSLSLFWLP